MKKFLVTLILFIFILGLIYGCFKEKNNNDITILTGTTIIFSLVDDLTSTLDIKNLVPPNMCPGHFDLKPDDVRKIKKAKLIIIHPYQKFLIKKILKINKNIKIEILKTKDLTIPENYFSGLNEVKKILLKYFPQKKTEIVSNENEVIRYIKNKIVEYNPILKKIKEKKYKVLSSIYQKEFARYLGFMVVGDFSSPDKLTIKKLQKLLKLSKEKNVKFIISNLTGDNDDTADILNKRLKVTKIVFSNFPLLKDNSEEHFIELWEKNILELQNKLWKK